MPGLLLRTSTRIVGLALVWLFVAVYLAQESLIAPQEMDEGLCLSHIELAARGQRP
jgi:hypothetical protein